MADISLKPSPAFADLASASFAGLTISELFDLAVVTVGVTPETRVEADAVLLKGYGVALPPPGRRAASETIALIWIAPGAWLAIASGADDLERELVDDLGPLASITDASGSRAVLRMSGKRARAVLARGLPIDLHRRAFKPDDAAVTHAAHIGVTIWQIDDAPTYDLAISRSYAASFAHWLAAAAASEAAAPL